MALIASVTVVLLSLLMGLRLLRRYVLRPRSHTLWYAVGLLLAALASVPDVYRGLTGGLPTLLWWVYWVAASALVGYLAVGTAYLLSPAIGKTALIFVSLVTIWLAVAVVATAGPAPAVLTEATLTKAPNGIIKAPFLINNIAGSLMILGGAALSYIKTRGWHAIWIGLGTLIFAASGATSGLLEYSQLFYFTQAAGIIVLYIGISISVSPRASRSAATG